MDILQASMLFQPLVKKTLSAFGSDSNGLYGKSAEPKAFSISAVNVDYLGEDKTFASLNVWLINDEGKCYNANTDGLIYTDPRFLYELNRLIGAASISAQANYSEYGMQGELYINFDIDLF